MKEVDIEKLKDVNGGKKQQFHGSFKVGAVVYFKQAKPTSRPKSKVIQFQGHGIGVFLGEVPKELPDPPREYINQAMGACGYIRFDDVMAFLGQDKMLECVEKFKQKYHPKVKPENFAPLVLPPEDGERKPKIRCNRETGHWGQPVCDCGAIQTHPDGTISLVGAKKPTGLVDTTGKPILSNEPERFRPDEKSETQRDEQPPN